MTVAQSLRKNTKITITTNPTVSSNVNCTSRTEARMVSVRSVRIETLTEVGSVACKRGRSALTRSAV